MKHLFALLAMIASIGLSAQFPVHSTLIDPNSGPFQHFGHEVLADGEQLGVFSYNSETYDAKLSFFNTSQDSTLAYSTEFFFEYQRNPTGFYGSDSVMFYRSMYISSVWGNRSKYLHYFTRDGDSWNYHYYDLDNLLGCGNMNVTSIVPTAHGTFLSTYRNCCGYQQTEWYQIFGFGSDDVTFNGPFCNVFNSGVSFHQSEDRVFLTNWGDDSIYELLFDDDESFEVITLLDQDLGQYQTGSWKDVFVQDSMIIGVMNYDDFYQGVEVVETILINVYDDQMDLIDSFNLSELFPNHDLCCTGAVKVNDEGFLHFDSPDLLLRYWDGQLSWIGFIEEYEGVAEGETAFNNNFLFKGVPNGNLAGVEAGEVMVFPMHYSEPIWGCVDTLACNYLDADYATNDCYYPDIYDCSGDCVNDVDEDGICDELDESTLDYLDGYNAGFLAGLSVSGQESCGPGTYWDDGFALCLPIEICVGDLNEDGIRGTGDLLLLLSYYGQFCPE